MSKKEAAEILGVNINASENQINAKYKKLMKSLHPDKDGSEYMSKLINKAKDTLLKS
ncbi:MAG: J domain-containing protein [Rickettsiales bacterium]|nr:J domain-containing protein [Rickettsiales bacterium]